MLISDMAPGTPISLELSIADAHYEIPTTIVSSKPGYILIAPFSFNGTVIDLDSSRNMVINVYTIDPLTENRIVWIILDRDGLRIPITICNVSDHGLSFITPDELDSVSTNIYKLLG
ncbi:MAG: hypothetical protein SO361_10640 [Lachnospira sp.]|nr:hypothetical protein [Lachnospira sp.]